MILFSCLGVYINSCIILSLKISEIICIICRELSLASLNMARSQSMPGLAGSLAAFGGAFMGGGSGLSRRSRLMRGSRDGSTSGGSIDGSSVKRSNSVSRTRLASPLPSLAEQEDRYVFSYVAYPLISLNSVSQFSTLNFNNKNKFSPKIVVKLPWI